MLRSGLFDKTSNFTDMTREEFLALANAQYDKLADLQSESTFYAYEEGFVKVWTELGGQVMQASLKSGASNDKRKKTTVKPGSAD
jgi:hypothetical protein